jgi:hypothetical protein
LHVSGTDAAHDRAPAVQAITVAHAPDPQPNAHAAVSFHALQPAGPEMHVCTTPLLLHWWAFRVHDEQLSCTSLAASEASAGAS